MNLLRKILLISISIFILKCISPKNNNKNSSSNPITSNVQNSSQNIIDFENSIKEKDLNQLKSIREELKKQTVNLDKKSEVDKVNKKIDLLSNYIEAEIGKNSNRAIITIKNNNKKDINNIKTKAKEKLDTSSFEQLKGEINNLQNQQNTLREKYKNKIKVKKQKIDIEKQNIINEINKTQNKENTISKIEQEEKRIDEAINNQNNYLKQDTKTANKEKEELSKNIKKSNNLNDFKNGINKLLIISKNENLINFTKTLIEYYNNYKEFLGNLKKTAKEKKNSTQISQIQNDSSKFINMSLKDFLKSIKNKSIDDLSKINISLQKEEKTKKRNQMMAAIIDLKKDILNPKAYIVLTSSELGNIIDKSIQEFENIIKDKTIEELNDIRDYIFDLRVKPIIPDEEDLIKKDNLVSGYRTKFMIDNDDLIKLLRTKQNQKNKKPKEQNKEGEELQEDKITKARKANIILNKTDIDFKKFIQNKTLEKLKELIQNIKKMIEESSYDKLILELYERKKIILEEIKNKEKKEITELRSKDIILNKIDSELKKFLRNETIDQLKELKKGLEKREKIYRSKGYLSLVSDLSNKQLYIAKVLYEKIKKESKTRLAKEEKESKTRLAKEIEEDEIKRGIKRLEEEEKRLKNEIKQNETKIIDLKGRVEELKIEQENIAKDIDNFSMKEYLKRPSKIIELYTDISILKSDIKRNKIKLIRIEEGKIEH